MAKKKLDVFNKAHTHWVDFDIPWNTPISALFSALRPYRVHIINFDPQGPAGGNPNALLTFSDKEEALKFLKNWYGDNHGEDDLRDRIIKI